MLMLIYVIIVRSKADKNIKIYCYLFLDTLKFDKIKNSMVFFLPYCL